MRLNRRSKRFHDPWGNKRGNHGSVINRQWLVGDDVYTNRANYYIDKTISYEATGAKFIVGSQSVEKIRK